VWAKRRWNSPNKPEFRQDAGHGHQVRSDVEASRATTCPACRQQHDGLPGGFVHLDGAFLESHFAEIERMLRNEAERAADLNPLVRIMHWERTAEHGLTISTTTDHLALRLGRALEAAFGGDARITFSHENKLTRVRWQRD
jgi:hypothetical protein